MRIHLYLKCNIFSEAFFPQLRHMLDFNILIYCRLNFDCHTHRGVLTIGKHDSVISRNLASGAVKSNELELRNRNVTGTVAPALTWTFWKSMSCRCGVGQPGRVNSGTKNTCTTSSLLTFPYLSHGPSSLLAVLPSLEAPSPTPPHCRARSARSYVKPQSPQGRGRSEVVPVRPSRRIRHRHRRKLG